MKVKELINKLLDYNMEAEVKVIAHCKEYDYNITFGGVEGLKKHNTKEISFYVNELRTNEIICKHNWIRKADSFNLKPYCEKCGIDYEEQQLI